MKNIAIRYDSKGGNTKKLAEMIASEVGATALAIDKPIEGEIDILFVGGWAHMLGSMGGNIKKAVKALDSKKIKLVAAFGTSGKANIAGKIAGLAKECGLTVVDSTLLFNVATKDDKKSEMVKEFVQKVNEAFDKLGTAKSSDNKTSEQKASDNKQEEVREKGAEVVKEIQDCKADDDTANNKDDDKCGDDCKCGCACGCGADDSDDKDDNKDDVNGDNKDTNKVEDSCGCGCDCECGCGADDSDDKDDNAEIADEADCADKKTECDDSHAGDALDSSDEKSSDSADDKDSDNKDHDDKHDNKDDVVSTSESEDKKDEQSKSTSSKAKSTATTKKSSGGNSSKKSGSGKSKKK